MSEPPGPRSPGDDAVPGEPDPFQEEANALAEGEFLDEMADDMLLDQLGQGDDDRRGVGFDMPEEEHDLRDMALDAQEAINEEPIPELVSVDDAMAIIAEAKKKRDEQKAKANPPRPPATPGGNAMSATESAARLQEIAGSTLELGMVQEIVTQLESGRGNALSALGQGHSESATITGPFEQALLRAGELRDAIAVAYRTCGDVAGRLS